MPERTDLFDYEPDHDIDITDGQGMLKRLLKAFPFSQRYAFMLIVSDREEDCTACYAAGYSEEAAQRVKAVIVAPDAIEVNLKHRPEGVQ